MKYYVTVEGQEHEIELDGRNVRLDGRQLEARLETIPQTPLRLLMLDGKSRTYALVRDDAGWTVQSDGLNRRAVVEDERARQLQRMTGGAKPPDRGGVVVAPMPGMVLRLEVEVGQAVRQGEGVAVLEAMKMENEIRAPAGGIVSAIHVAPGQAVEKGTKLVELEPQA